MNREKHRKKITALSIIFITNREQKSKIFFLITGKISKKYMTIYRMRRVQRYTIFDFRFDSFREKASQIQRNYNFPGLYLKNYWTKNQKLSTVGIAHYIHYRIYIF